MFKTSAASQQFTLEAAIKNIGKMSSELKKMTGNSEFLVHLNMGYEVRSSEWLGFLRHAAGLYSNETMQMLVWFEKLMKQ